MQMNVYDKNQAREQLVRTTTTFLIQRGEKSEGFILPTDEEIKAIMKTAKVIVDTVFETYPPIDASSTSAQQDLPI